MSSREFAEWCEYFRLCDEEDAAARAQMLGLKPKRQSNTRGLG